MTTSKTCRKCLREKPLSDFYRDKRADDGLRVQCKECMSAYFEANRERKRDYDKSRRASDPERFRSYDIARWPDRRERKLEQDKEYRALNRDSIRARRQETPHPQWAYQYRLRAIQYGHEVVEENFTKTEVVDRYGDSCFYCGGEFNEIDHYVPVVDGGTHTLDNVRPSCVGCNRAKNCTPGDEWIAGRGEASPHCEERPS